MSLTFEQLIASIRQTHEYMAAYPQIRGTLSPKFDLVVPDAIRKSVISESTAVATPTIRESVPPELQIPPERLVKSLSFSHFAELIAIGDRLKRVFYEIECMRGNWSVRELKRQIPARTTKERGDAAVSGAAVEGGGWWGVIGKKRPG